MLPFSESISEAGGQCNPPNMGENSDLTALSYLGRAPPCFATPSSYLYGDIRFKGDL
jgi:hypothetical protein